MNILVTGAGGFIGANLVLRLLKFEKDVQIVGLDSLNDYYEVRLKEYRLKQITKLAAEVCEPAVSEALRPFDSVQEPQAQRPCNHWTFIKGNLADKDLVDSLFEQYHFDIVVNLAAQAGVRYSIENPDAYIESNVIGFYNILEACRHHLVQHLVYASSSSVYGGNLKTPFSTDDNVDHPVSLYAATKKSNELFAYCYSKLYDIPTTGLRFFTVYGPAGRPDMAYFDFTNKLLKGETIQLYNYGNCFRDFTYVDDIVEGIVLVMKKPPEVKVPEPVVPEAPRRVEGPTTASSNGPYAIYNIGGGQPVKLLDFVQILQEELVRASILPKDYDFETHKQLVPMQSGDVPVTYADTSALERDFGFVPKITLREGLRKFAKWYKEFYLKQ
jgi:nucleoside-diphosphate-sugar epimerase